MMIHYSVKLSSSAFTLLGKSFKMKMLYLTVVFALLNLTGANFCFKRYVNKTGTPQCRQRFRGIKVTDIDECCKMNCAGGFARYHSGVRCTACPPKDISIWSNWTDWRACSASCGEGTKLRYRTCQSDSCSGDSVELQPCIEQPCPSIDGGWSLWSNYTSCDKSCGGGLKTRSRSCNNPPPGNGGRECEGSKVETVVCKNQPCPVDGAWSNWKCIGTCQNGIVTWTRECNNPEPQYGGKQCTGSFKDARECSSVQNCPEPTVTPQTRSQPKRKPTSGALLPGEEEENMTKESLVDKSAPPNEDGEKNEHNKSFSVSSSFEEIYELSFKSNSS